MDEEAIVENADRFGLSNSCLAHIDNEIRAAEGVIAKDNQEKVLYKS